MRYLKKYKYHLLLILFIISLISSIILSIANTEQICDINKGCDIVQNSKYSETFGIKNSVYGIIIFSLLIIITIMQIYKSTKNKKIMISTAIILGSLIAIYFIYLQQFVIKSYCKYCMIVDISLILALILLIITWKK